VPRFLALDWDAGHVHVLAATAGKGGLKLDRALAWPEELPPAAGTAEGFGQRLKEHLKEAGVAAAPLLVAVGRDRVVLKEVRYPAVPAHEEPGVVRFQAVKELTDPADEVTIDFQAAESPDPTGERKALAVAVRRDVIAAYRTLAAAAGVKLVGAAPRAFGVIACLRRTANPAPQPGTAFAVLSVGEKGGEFAVARGEALAFARPLGGPALTSDAALLGEIRRNLAVYAGQAPQYPVRALYVAEAEGPSLGIADRLRDTLAIPVFRFDPLGGQAPPVGSTVGSFAGAAGLLHLYGRSKELPINFVKPREPKPPADPSRKLLAWAGGIAAALVLALGVVGYSLVAAKQKEVDRLQGTIRTLDESLSKVDQDERRIAAMDQWLKSEIVWPDELYDLTDRFPDITRLRLTEMNAEALQLPPAQPGVKLRDDTKPVARVKLKGLSSNDDPPSALVRQLVKDAPFVARVDPKDTRPNTTGNRRQFAIQWSTAYYLAHRPKDQYVRKLTVAAPERNRNRGGGGELGGFPQFFPGGN
jgi:Tfp pilus assembly PilM family ATPase